MTQWPRSLQDVIRRRQQAGFVGRRDQLALVDEQLVLPLDDSRRRIIISIHGVAGVGKTLLVRQLCQRAADRGVLFAYVDDTVDDAPAAMNAVATALEREGARLRRFRSRYQVYEQHRAELEADPAAPEGIGTWITKTAVRAVLHTAKSVPVVGPTAGLIDEGQAAEQADRLRRYLAAKFRDQSEVQLLLTPIDVLSPLFVEDLFEVGERHRLVLFFDTYERTGGFLEPWLLSLLEGRYGELPANLTFTIAGQYPLDPNRWAAYNELLANLPLESFDDQEARQLCAHYNVVDERVIEVILALSGRLPLLVALLAAARPESETQIGDPTGDAIDRFLRWEQNPQRREVAIAAALPRTLNRDLLGVLLGSDVSEELFDWLCRLPFVTGHAVGYRYHQVVRAQMLRRLRRDSPEGWRRYHETLANYHHMRCESLGLDVESGWHDSTWREHALSETYHRLCASAATYLPNALDQTLRAYQVKRALAKRWAQTLLEAGIDAGAANVSDWGQRLLDRAGDTDADAVAFLTELIQDAQLPADRQATAFVERTACLGRLGRYDEALDDVAEALAHRSDDDRALDYRGTTYRMLGRYEQAVADLTHALALEPTNRWALAQRGEAHRQLSRYQEALTDLTRALELEPADAWALAQRGETYRLLGRYEEALADLTHALDIDPAYAWALAHRGETYRQLDRFEEALTDLNHALELEPDYPWTLGSRGAAYRQLSRYQEALTDLTHALELEPMDAWTLAHRGETYRMLGRYEEALTDLTHALELEPMDAWTLAHRGEVFRMLGRHEMALGDLTRALELNSSDAWTLAHRGETQRQLGHFEEALTDLTRALDLSPGTTSGWALAQRGETYRQVGRYEEALTDLTRALELNPDNAWALGSRGETYRQLGRYEEALTDLTRALELDPTDSQNQYRHRQCRRAPSSHE